MDRLAERVAATVASEIRPTQTILFGSRARGDSRPESDVDVLIIYDGPLPKREVILRAHRLFPGRDFSLDIVVLTSREYEMQKDVVATVGRAAARQGIVCHA
jgi:predicted nucleotidyltransferase